MDIINSIHTKKRTRNKPKGEKLMKRKFAKLEKGLKVAAVVFAVAAMMGTESYAGDDTFKIARDKTIPGKFGHETCDIFAKELYSRLVAAGGEAHYIVYEWDYPGKGSGRHAIVVYRDAQGRYFGMDQTKRQPVWLTGSTPSQWVSWFNGPGDTRVLRSVTEPNLAGQYADLSRPSRANNGSNSRMVAMQ